MRYKLLAVAGLASLLAIGAFGRQEGQTPPNQPNPGMMGRGEMMGGGMTMGMMGQMTIHHQQMSELMNKLMENMTAIQNEKDPVALKAKIAKQQVLLGQMHDQMTQQGEIMQSMSGHMEHNCPMASNMPPPSDKVPAR